MTLDAPLDQIPVLVRAGSIIPMVESDRLWLHVFASRSNTGNSGEKRTSVLYSDDGDGYGDSRVDRFTLEKIEGGYKMVWMSEGDYAWPYESVHIQLHGFDLDQVLVDSQPVQFGEGSFDVPLQAEIKLLEKESESPDSDKSDSIG